MTEKDKRDAVDSFPGKKHFVPMERWTIEPEKVLCYGFGLAFFIVCVCVCKGWQEP